jgi:hypothetical protein
MESLTRLQMTQLDQGQPMMVSRPLLDFRYTRKLHMRAAYDQLFPSVQTVMP